MGKIVSAGVRIILSSVTMLNAVDYCCRAYHAARAFKFVLRTTDKLTQAPSRQYHCTVRYKGHKWKINPKKYHYPI